MKDTGRGIDPENLPNIFNPFYSTKDSSLGLGLPMVHKIVASHQGQIEVDNRPGEGVTFSITFPAFEEEVRNPTHVLKETLALGVGSGAGCAGDVGPCAKNEPVCWRQTDEKDPGR